MKVIKTLLFAVHIILAQRVQAQITFTLQDCIDIATENSFTIQNANVNEDQARLSSTLAKHAFLPNLNANSSASVNFGRSIDPTANSFITESFISNNIGFGSDITIYSGGKLRTQKKIAELSTEISQLEKDDAKKRISQGVIAAFAAVLFAKENHSTAKNILNITMDQANQLYRQIESGVRPAQELQIMEAQISRNQYELEVAKNSVLSSKLLLSRWMNIDVSTEFDVINTNENTLKEYVSVSKEKLLKMAIKNNAYLKVFNQRNVVSKLNIKLAESNRLPRLTAGLSIGTNITNKGTLIDRYESFQSTSDVLINGDASKITFFQESPVYSKANYGYQFKNNLSYAAGLQLQIPIYNNYTAKYQLEVARLENKKAWINYKESLRNLEVDFEQAYLDVENSKNNLEAAQKATDAQLSSNNALQERFNAGIVSLTELNQANFLLANTKVAALRAKYELYWREQILLLFLNN